MSLLREFRSSLENPQTTLSYPAEWLLDIFNGGRTDSGLRVSQMTALQVTTVFSCINLIASAIGLLPFHVYEQAMQSDARPSKRLAMENELYDLLRYEPNPEMSSFTMRKTMQAHALLWGNCYAEIQRDAAGRVVYLWPRDPSRTRPRRLNGELVYETTDGMGEVSSPDGLKKSSEPGRLIAREDMIHIPGLSLDGRLGQDVVWLSRQAVGLALATEKFGAKFFGNGAHPNGILTHPGRLTPEAREQAKRGWQEAFGGENQLRTALLEQGITFAKVSVNPDEAQMLETRKFQVSEICRIFGVPPHMVSDTEKQNRANTEQIGLEFVTFTLGHWLEAWQQEFKRKLFPCRNDRAGSGGKYVVIFETRKLTMPDAASLGQLLTIIKQWGYGSTNDGRDLLDWNPIDEPWADRSWRPVNMVEAGQENPQPALEKGEPGSALAQRFVQSYSRLFADAIGRVLSRQSPDGETFRRAFLPVLGTIGERLAEMAALEFRCAPPAVAESPFLLDYIESMRLRAASQWRMENIALFSSGELSRAVKALLVEVYRAAGTQRAKELAVAQPQEV